MFCPSADFIKLVLSIETFYGLSFTSYYTMDSIYVPPCLEVYISMGVRYQIFNCIVLGVSIHRAGLLDWNTTLSYFPFLDKFLCLFLASSWLLYMDDCNSDNSCLLQCYTIII